MLKTSLFTSCAALLLLTPALDAQLVFTAGNSLPTSLSPKGIAAGDFDGDGDQDFAVANSDASLLSLYFMQGGVLAAGPSAFLSGQPNAVVAFDADGDGDLDLATANGNNQTVNILTNDGQGSFSLTATLPAGSKPRHLAAADLDGDGDVDLAVVNRNSNSVSLFTNSAGSFAAAGSFSVGADPRWIAAGDLDGDGDTDLAVVNHGSDSIGVHLNTGSASFGGATSLALLSPNAVELGDLDGDGDLDLAVTQGSVTPSAHGLVVFRNDGAPSFTNTGLHPTGSDPHGLELFDADGDGDLDVATADTDSNQASVLENLGSLAFAAAVSFATGVSPQDLASGSLDSDGDLDLAVTSGDSNTLATGFNQTTQSFTQYGMACGSAGFMPALSGAGESTPVGAVSFTFTGPVGAQGLLLLGAQPIDLPFAVSCHLLVGSQLGSPLPFALDAAGQLVIGTTLSPSAPLVQLYFQFLVADANAPNGRFGASNGLKMNVH